MWFLSLIGGLFAQPVPSDSERWDIATAHESRRTAALIALDKQWNATFRPGDNPVTDELVSIRRASAALPGYPQGPQLWLTGGDRIGGDCSRCTANELSFHVDLGSENQAKKKEGPIAIPRTSLSILWLKPFDLNEMLIQYPWLQSRRKTDYLLLTNGDTIQGVVSGLDREKKEVQVDQEGKNLIIPLARVLAVAFNTELTRNRIPAKPYGNLILKNGSRLRIAWADWKDDRLIAETLFRKQLTVPSSSIAGLDVYHGSAVYLSDLKPAQFEYQSYLGETYSWGADKALDGQPLQLHYGQEGTVCDKGLALHSPCKIEYVLDGKYHRLEALVGLDTRLGRRGNVQIQIEVDGKDVTPTELRQIKGSDHAIPLVVKLEKAKSLKLIVKMGDGGNVNDHVDWGDARLLR